MNRKAVEAIELSRSLLILEQAFWGSLALSLDLVEVEHEQELDTMAVDGKNLYFYAPYVLKLAPDELKGANAHEVEHCARKHMTRRNGRDPHRWNVSCDFSINPDLIDAGFKLPGQPVSLASPPGVKGHLLDPQFKGMSAEEIYERLPRDEIKIKVLWAAGSLCGSVRDPAQAGDPLVAEAIEREWETIVRMAAAAAAKQAGSMPAYARRLIEILNKPQVNWKDQTRQFIDGAMGKDYAWHRPNRRFAHQGIYLPGFIPDSIHHLVALNDVSGSITDNMLKSFVSEMGGALDDGVADRLTCVYFDTEIKKVDEWQPGDVIKADIPGRGGTDFRPAFKWVEENAPDASCIVILTDMEPITWNIPDPGIPVLWGAFCNPASLAKLKVPFGDVLHIDQA